MSYNTATVKAKGVNTTRDATGSNVYELFQASQACYVERVIFQSLGTNAVTAARVFINQQDPKTSGDNNYLNREATLAATTASGTAGLAAVELVLDLYLSAGQRLLVTIDQGITAGWDVSAIVAPNYTDFNVR